MTSYGAKTSHHQHEAPTGLLDIYIWDLDFLYSTNARGASEKSQYVYSERNLFIDIQKTSVNRNRDSAHKEPQLTSMIKNVSPTQGPN